MPVDAEQILEKARKKRQTRITVSFYLSEEVVKNFKLICKEDTRSPVVEALLQDFIDSHSAQKKKSRGG